MESKLESKPLCGVCKKTESKAPGSDLPEGWRWKDYPPGVHAWFPLYKDAVYKEYRCSTCPDERPFHVDV